MRSRCGTRATIPLSARGSTDIALRLGLLRTGGSDWHGDPAPGESHGALGSQEVPADWLDRLESVRGNASTPMVGP